MATALEPRLVSEYTRLVASPSREFWNAGKILHLRSLATIGGAVRMWTPANELCSRPLDRLRFRGVGYNNTDSGVTPHIGVKTDTSTKLAHGRISMSSPLYLGDMSYGALSGIANVALARAADMTGVLTGTGEGGLNPEVAKCKRITVQWASARFGVDIGVLNTGLAIVIKIGQGAKPGIGGHLPGAKVTESISSTRRIPIGIDAISPAPHHDIYSIEDLGQRIWALKEATGKPVFVKVGATNYIPYIASGIARMGGDGIIIDAHGAGTGAAPSVVKDNVGIPIELAVASVDGILRKDNLRDGFSVIAAGRVSNAEDTAKLMALGADCVSIGTAALIAMGCVMVHKCNLGFCPALLTNKIDKSPSRILSLDKSLVWSVNLINGWTEELMLILEELGLKNLTELIGRRELLVGYNMNSETAGILGVCATEISHYAPSPPIMGDKEYWTSQTKRDLQEMAGATGRSSSEPVISSMGSIGAPFVETPKRISDWLVVDGAQVTRPSIDPYREKIETACYLAEGGIRLSAPILFAPLYNGESRLLTLFARVANRMGLLMDAGQTKITEELARHARRMIVSATEPIRAAAYFITGDAWREQLRAFSNKRPLYIRQGCSEDGVQAAVEAASQGLNGVILDEDMDCKGRIHLEVAASAVDRALREIVKHDLPLRNQFDVIVVGGRIRHAGDILKMCGLGADAVGISRAAVVAIGYDEKWAHFEEKAAEERLENLVFAMQKEIKLLAGAAGLTNIFTTLIGNRELFRSLDLEPRLRERLHVKPAGAL